MKLKVIILSLLCVTCLVGCSSSSDMALENSVIHNNKKAVTVTEHKGITASTVIDGVGTIEYYICDTTDNCVHNAGEIFKEDMTKYSKKGLYYTRYLGTEITLYYKYGKQYIESRMTMDNVDVMSVEAAVARMYSESENLVLGYDVDSIDFEDTLTVNVTDREFAVRQKEVVIPGLLRVKYDDGSVKCDQHVTIGDKSVAKTSTNKYDYYQYGGSIIQAAVGTDISSLITFK